MLMSRGCLSVFGLPRKHSRGFQRTLIKYHILVGKAESRKKKGSSCSGHLIQRFGGTACLIGALSGKWGWGWWGRMGVSMEANGMFSWFAAPFCLECLPCFVTSFLYAPLPSPLQQTDWADSAASWLTPSLLHLSRHLEIWEFTVNPHDMKLKVGGSYGCEIHKITSTDVYCGIIQRTTRCVLTSV